ncbi:hypothetical protein HNR48_004039 [Pseudoteredinibacter isoporae]|uniref:Uncharacterized protein n=1 Tax=Pseudoteredinibacter isoporae TaxID=570281 RepID=A0A7X0MXZ3_9GAMM|nr:hypothetical protein [Pseudoteredinibacter isoporae]
MCVVLDSGLRAPEQHAGGEIYLNRNPELE